MVDEVEIYLQHGFKRSRKPTMIIVHCMAEIIDTEPEDTPAVEWLDKLGLSAHCLIQSDGTVIRCRHDEDGAYHAKGYNADSLGVEFLVPGVHTYATWMDEIKRFYLSKEQYINGVDLCREWVDEFDIVRENVLRHSDVSPGRKVDPGEGFPWDEFLDKVFE